MMNHTTSNRTRNSAFRIIIGAPVTGTSKEATTPAMDKPKPLYRSYMTSKPKLGSNANSGKVQALESFGPSDQASNFEKPKLRNSSFKFTIGAPSIAEKPQVFGSSGKTMISETTTSSTPAKASSKPIDQELRAINIAASKMKKPKPRFPSFNTIIGAKFGNQPCIITKPKARYPSLETENDHVFEKDSAIDETKSMANRQHLMIRAFRPAQGSFTVIPPSDFFDPFAKDKETPPVVPIDQQLLAIVKAAVAQLPLAIEVAISFLPVLSEALVVAVFQLSLMVLSSVFNGFMTIFNRGMERLNQATSNLKWFISGVNRRILGLRLIQAMRNYKWKLSVINQMMMEDVENDMTAKRETPEKSTPSTTVQKKSTPRPPTHMKSPTTFTLHKSTRVIMKGGGGCNAYVWQSDMIRYELDMARYHATKDRRFRPLKPTVYFHTPSEF